MGRYNVAMSNDTHKRVAGGGTTALGITGTVLGGLAVAGMANGGCNKSCNNGGIIGNILGWGNNECYVSDKEFAWAQAFNAQGAELAKEKSERYTDQVGLELYEAIIAETRRVDDKQSASIAAANTELVALREENAVLKSDVRCLSVLNQEQHKQLASEFNSAIALESERRACGDENILTYVKSNYIRGALKLNADDICPEVQLKCPDVQLVQLLRAATAAQSTQTV